MFPVTVFVNGLETYTFAVFGKNDKKIEKEPVILLKNEEHVSYPPPQTCKNQQIALLVNISSVLNSRLRIVIPWLFEYTRITPMMRCIQVSVVVLS